MHLFGFDNGSERYDESAVLEAGSAPVAIDLAPSGLRLGLSVCYDLRFPELYRALAADLIAVPRPSLHITGQAHWDPPLRARAVESPGPTVIAPGAGRHASRTAAAPIAGVDRGAHAAHRTVA